MQRSNTNIPAIGDSEPIPSREVIWFLVGRTSQDSSIRHIPLCESPFTIGRRSDASLQLASNNVSSLHAEIATDGESLVLRDLRSTNGTFVNGERVHDSIELQPDDLVQFASAPFRIAMHSAVTSDQTTCEDSYELAMLLVQFDRLMTEKSVEPHYQPIVDLRNNDAVIGYEVLARSQIAGLESAHAMFSTAARLNLETKLSEMMRWNGVERSMTLESRPHLFLNTHPLEINSPDLMESIRRLREFSPNQKLTLEIHEGAATPDLNLRRLRDQLHDMDISLAFDDFGAGQARLTQLSEVGPDYLKFDMSLIQNLHTSPKRTGMVATLVKIVRDMQIAPLAEGIETEADREICEEIGFEFGQGYLFGKPAKLTVTG
ncbi:MAG: EAL domain-containing protein [Planctomycetales bacterium]|nr:EAL domain-containing protein [Planctomycetales bacterium]